MDGLSYRSQKETSILYECIYVESIKMVMLILFVKQKETQTGRTNIWIPGGRRDGRNWEIEVDTYTVRGAWQAIFHGVGHNRVTRHSHIR